MLTKDFNSLVELFEVFSTEQKCIDHLEKLRWNGNVVSPFDCTSKVYKCKDNKYRCKNTGKYFNVKTNTLFDNTKIPLKKWFAAIWLVTCHKRGISSLQLSKDIDVTQKTAWFMLRRIRKIIKSDKQTLKINNLTMENKKLAIEGHRTRYKEVIEILEMLGGKMKGKIIGNCSFHVYFINLDGNIDYTAYSLINDAIIFTIEEFLEKYPFKVGDKVKTIYGKIGNVSKCKWDADNNCVIYKLDTSVYNNSFYFAHELIPNKEEIKAEDRFEIYTDHAIDDDSKTDMIINGERLIAPNGYTIGNATRNNNKLIVEYVKSKPQYPKTFQECYALKYNGQINLNIGCDILHGAYSEQLECLQSLLISRDAYWEIAGEEMGLSEPWKPDWYDEYESKFVIMCSRNDIIEETYVIKNAILAFPTEEMRDAFFENFKDLIEKCKEFL